MVEGKNNKQKNRTKYFLPGGKKQIQAVCAFLFLGVLILSCGVNLMHKDRQMSEKEMRMLAQKPEISLSGIASGRFMEQYEEYVSDQFAGRDTWVRIKTFADSVAGRTEEGGVFKGKDHYLMEDVAVADESDLKENLDAMKNFKERYPDIQMHMMLVPNAANVMEDKLPAFAVTASQSRQISRVKAELGDSYDWIDAEKVLDALENRESNFKVLYDDELSLKEKIETIAKEIYGADGVTYSNAANKELKRIEDLGMGDFPVCMAKTQYSLSDDQHKLGRPSGFSINVREVYVNAGAGFVVVVTGAIMTMPGLPKQPAANNIDVNEEGAITGLF